MGRDLCRCVQGYEGSKCEKGKQNYKMDTNNDKKHRRGSMRATLLLDRARQLY